MFIQTEPTPNPEVLKFLPGRIVLGSGTAEYRTSGEAESSPLAERLSELPGLSVLSSEGNFISIDISSTGLSAADFVAAALSEGVLIRSLETHHATRRFVRVTVGTRAENARCVRALERVLSRRGTARAPRLVAASSDA